MAIKSSNDALCKLFTKKSRCAKYLIYVKYMGKNVIWMLTVLFIIAGYIFGTCIRKFTIIYVYSAKNGRARFDSRQRRRDFSSSLCVQTGSGAHPDSFLYNGYRGSFLRE
jgi:hypothetical protein